MNVYQLDFDGFYLRTIAADPNPRPDPEIEGDEFLIPAGCITTPPPSFQAGRRARWNGSAWELVRVTTPPAPEDLTPEEQLALAREGWSLSDIQFAIMAQRPEYGFMTAGEAADWVGAGAIPASALAVLDQIEDLQERAEATIRFRGARILWRLDPFVLLLQQFFSIPDAVMDEFFTEGAGV